MTDDQKIRMKAVVSFGMTGQCLLKGLKSLFGCVESEVDFQRLYG